MIRATILRYFLVAIVATCVTPATVAQIDKGIDALPLLALNSNLIVTVANAAQVPLTTERVQLFRLQLDAVLRGTLPVDQLLVMQQRTYGDSVVGDLEKSCAFLYGPLTADDKNRWQISSAEPVYMFVGGKTGHVSITNPARLTGIVEYLSSGGPKPTDKAHEWSLKYLGSDDPFLQYSAIHQLLRFHKADTLNLLGNMVLKNQFTDDNKVVAVASIAAFGTIQSTEILTRIANQATQPAVVRETSVYGLTFLPQGVQQLTKWQSTGDALLKSAADTALRQQKQFMPP